MRLYLKLVPKQNVIDTGCHFLDISDDWILDGEYITKDKDDEKIINLYFPYMIGLNGHKEGCFSFHKKIFLDVRILWRLKIFCN